MHLFHYLKVGLSALLVFIGIKMLAHHFLESIGFKTVYSLYVILGILAISVLASLIFPKKKSIEPKLIAEEEAENEPQKEDEVMQP